MNKWSESTWNPDMSDVSKNYQEVVAKIAGASSRAGRSEGSAKLLVVSKRWPAEIVRQVVDLGHSLLGESRIQEAEEKIPQLPDGIEWHFIGHIQKTLKINRTNFSYISSVDRYAETE